MISVKHLLGTLNIMPHFTGLFPWHRGQPVDIGAHDGRFGRHWRHHLELVELGIGLAERLFRHTRVVDLLAQIVKLAVPFIQIAHFLLDSLHLFIQIVLALAALHLFLDATTDAFFHLQQINLAIEHTKYMLDSLAQRQNLKNRLFLFQLQRQMSRHGVDQTTWLINAGQRRNHL